MRIAIIGAGNIGGNLARRLGPLGHDVRLANSRGPETLQADFGDVEGVTLVRREDAAQGAEVVVVTIPFKAVPELPDDLLAGAADDVAVLDTNNYYPQQRDGRIDAIEEGQVESLWVAEHLGHTVVKAFNGVYAQRILDAGQPGWEPFAIPVAGDDPTAKQTVMGLVEQLGFIGVDAGGLADSWRQQPGMPVYGAQLNGVGIRDALEAASRERPAEFRA